MQFQQSRKSYFLLYFHDISSITYFLEFFNREFIDFCVCSVQCKPSYSIIFYKNKKDWVNIMKEKLMRFMYGRYGVDTFGKFLLWSGVILMLITSIFHFSYFLCNWMGIRDILLLSHVFTSDLQACTGKPEVSPAHFKDPWIFCKTEVYGSAAQDTPHLQVSKLQTEDPCSKGKR